MKSICSRLIVLAFVLTACSGQPAMPTMATPSPAATPAPPTSPPTATPSIPTIDVDGVQVPDPKVTNPELFDLKNPDSPIVQLANAFGLKPQNVTSGLTANLETPQDLPSFVTLRSADGVALIMAQQNTETKEWSWQKAVPGTYWRANGNKDIGVYLNTEEFRSISNQGILREHFVNGLLAREGTTPTDFIAPQAIAVAQEAKVLDASYYFHYVGEPGKFPAAVNSGNVDTWLDSRLNDILTQLIKNNTVTGRSLYIAFNEAWGETSGWNPDPNPLRNKYGNDKWVGEYVYRLLFKFVNAGLIPNKDFVIVFNDARLYNRPDKQELVLSNLSRARQDAFGRLVADPAMHQKLSQMGINKVEDILILLASETHTQLGSNEDDATFWPAPTDGQLTQLAEKFSILGGVIMTEVNPFGTQEQRQIFLKRMSTLLGQLPSFRGMIFWNVFKDSDDGNPNYPLSGDRLTLFDDSGNPTLLYYALLSK